MYEVKMPRLGVTMQSGIITEWLAEEGEHVTKGDYLFELETEKSNLEIEAQESGVLKKILVAPDEEVPVNTVIAILAAEDEEVDWSKYENPQEDEKPVAEEKQGIKKRSDTPAASFNHGKAAPRARKLAKELGISLEGIEGTGKDGVITEKDIQTAAGGAGAESLKVKETVALTSIQKKMTQNVLSSWQSIPQFTQMVTVNMENAMKVKKELDDVSFNDLIVKAVANAVAVYPFVNSKLEKDEKITIYEDINVAVAINSQHGLVVPVVKNTDRKSAKEIGGEIKKLAEKAEGKSLDMDDLTGGTITVSNLGSLGIESGTPIINQPQSAIIFAGAIKKIPVVNNNDEIVIAPIMTLSICYDHRFIDGVSGATFTNHVKQAFENMTRADLE